MEEAAPPPALGPRRDPLVGAWLVAIVVAIIGMILLGGATRLTDSGLSITEWRPVTGALPPAGDAGWARAFDLYKGTTQYQVQNPGMSLEDFKVLFWWEWTHRLLGRAIGVLFAIPFLYFWATGRLRGRFWPTLLLFALGGLQGAIGWWMVQSGLAGRVSVSSVRLAIHLGLAFLILALAVRQALAAFAWPRSGGELGADRRVILWFMALLFTQILLGALVAGADAGRAYSDWPTIGGSLFPPSYGALSPFLRNFVENHATLQFNHRLVGYATASFGLFIAVAAMLKGRGPARWAAILLGVLALGQASLGVAVIMTGAPLDLSLTHQFGAVLMWVTAMTLGRAAAQR